MFGIKLRFWIALLLFVVILFIIKGAILPGFAATEGMTTKEGVDGTATVTGSKKTSTDISTVSTS